MYFTLFMYLENTTLITGCTGYLYLYLGFTEINGPYFLAEQTRYYNQLRP